MGADSKIEWTHHTFNPWIGCTKVSPGCAHCYAETLDHNRFSKTLGGATKEAPIPHWGKGAPRHRTSEANWNQPLQWNAHEQRAEAKFGPRLPHIPRPRVFCASLADWLDDEVDASWLLDLLDLIRRTPYLDWLLLTKRPQLFEARMRAAWDARDDDRMDAASMAFNWLKGDVIPANVWIGTTVEDQARADERLPALLKIPAPVRFLSCEPLLEQVRLDWVHLGCRQWVSKEQIHWVICGGESGTGARPFCTEWAWDLLRQCRQARVPFFMKQLGAAPITSNANALEWPDETIFADDLLDTQWAAGGSVKLTDRKGGKMAEWPEELKVQEFPR